jgi:hypothetical protein
MDAAEASPELRLMNSFILFLSPYLCLLCSARSAQLRYATQTSPSTPPGLTSPVKGNELFEKLPSLFFVKKCSISCNIQNHVTFAHIIVQHRHQKKDKNTDA